MACICSESGHIPYDQARTMDFPRDLSNFRYRNILLIDDEPAIHEVYATYLRPDTESQNTNVENGQTVVDSKRVVYNFNLYDAYDGEEALRICKNQTKRNFPLQMAFVDMRMKGWDGIETVRQLHDFDPRMSFVIVTGFPQDTQQQVEERLGAAALQILAKPVSMEELYGAAYSLTGRWNRLHGDA